MQPEQHWAEKVTEEIMRHPLITHQFAALTRPLRDYQEDFKVRTLKIIKRYAVGALREDELRRREIEKARLLLLLDQQEASIAKWKEIMQRSRREKR